MKTLARLLWLVTFMLRLGFHHEMLAQEFDSIPRSLALGRAGLAMVDSLVPPSSIAARPLVTKSYFQVTFDRPFGMPELQRGSLKVSHRFRPFTAGISVSSFSFDSYRESTASIGIASKIISGPRQTGAVGVRLHATHISIQNHEKDISLLAEATWLFYGNSEFSLGGRIVSGFNRADSRFDSPVRRIDLGVMYVPADWMRIVLDVQKTPGIDLAFSSGMEIQVSRSLWWRSGWNSLPGEWTAGLGIDARSLIVDFAFAKHHWLGWTSQAGLTVIW